MNFAINIIALVLSAYFAKESYDDYRIGPAMFWTGLSGWDLHALLSYL